MEDQLNFCLIWAQTLNVRTATKVSEYFVGQQEVGQHTKAWKADGVQDSASRWYQLSCRSLKHNGYLPGNNVRGLEERVHHSSVSPGIMSYPNTVSANWNGRSDCLIVKAS